MPFERLARVETDVGHIKATIDEVRKTQLEIVAKMNQAEGAAKASKVIGHSITAFVEFAVSQFGGFIHLQ